MATASSLTAFAWTAINYSTPNWDEMVIYKLHVGSFLFDPASPAGAAASTPSLASCRTLPISASTSFT
jgi:1,4-alpha-glucan branching enzyme